ncbi:MAG: hypothetical protein GEV00_12950 [Actinophytocola sp.]|nr:hypothetical protein [Actinophytocola sp.]
MTGGRFTAVVDGIALTLLLVNSVVLAMLELFFLPLRFDGIVLPDLGGAPFPVTVLLAIVTTPWLVSQTAQHAVRMGGPAGFGGVSLGLWFMTVVGVGLSGPGGDLMLPQDWRTIALVAGGALPAAIVLGRVLAQSRIDRARASGRAMP